MAKVKESNFINKAKIYIDKLIKENEEISIKIKSIENTIQSLPSKHCNKCKELKRLDFFYIDNRTNKHNSRCIKCQNVTTTAYRLKNPKKYSKKKYKDNHKDYTYLSMLYKLETNDIFKLKSYIRSRLNRAIQSKQKIGSSIDDLGCSIEFLKQYLEKQFHIGMTWENYGEWHIDHIKALANFNLENREEFLKAVHYTNLQPLWAKDNLMKSNK